jgi:peptidyl-prolyl cis-trans isomerase A (cyclophilin A)
MRKNVSFSGFGWLLPSVAVAVGCSKSPPELVGQVPERRAEPSASAFVGASASASATDNGAAGRAPVTESSSTPLSAPAGSGSVVQKGGTDPLKGRFTLADATKDLAGQGALLASIETNKGRIECKLLSEKAPITVANFIGLARGLRPWKDTGENWVKRPAYDGTTFHRIIKGFMIQGGDARGNGSGEPGYVIPDELWEGAKHDKAGLLCMANRGPNTNGAQFFITDAAAAHLDSSYTIFGTCEPVATINAIARVEVDGEKPRTPVIITSIKIQHGPSVAKK